MNAICKLGIVPVRKLPDDSAEMVTQLLHGEHCYIVRDTNNWLEIEAFFDGYSGFVDSKQLSIVGELPSTAFITTKAIVHIDQLYFPMGSELIEKEHSPDILDLLLSNGEIIRPDESKERSSTIETALRLIGSPYLWGGKSLLGIDCSGLTQVVFKACGYRLPRDSWQQAESGNSIDLENARSGDLAFFTRPGKTKVSHVGIIMGNESGNQVIHASGMVRIDKLTTQGIIAETGSCTHELVDIRDVISP